MPALRIIKQEIQGAGPGAGASLVTNCHFHKHPCLISVVPQIEPVPLFIGVNVEVGEGAEDLLEGEEGGRDSLGLIMSQLFACHTADLKHFEVAHQSVIVSKVVARHDETLARFAPDVAEAVVAEVRNPGPRTEVNTAVGSSPALGTETETCATVAVTAAIIKTEKIHNILWWLGELLNTIPRPQRRVAANRLPAVLLDPVQVEYGVPRVSSVHNVTPAVLQAGLNLHPRQPGALLHDLAGLDELLAEQVGLADGPASLGPR